MMDEPVVVGLVVGVVVGVFVGVILGLHKEELRVLDRISGEIQCFREHFLSINTTIAKGRC